MIGWLFVSRLSFGLCDRERNLCLYFPSLYGKKTTDNKLFTKREILKGKRMKEREHLN